MNETGFQNDFFGEGTKPQKPKNKGVLKNYPEQRFLPFIKIPMEYTIIIIIILLVMMVVAYAVGVEKGSRSAIMEMENMILEQGEDNLTADAQQGAEEDTNSSLDGLFWDEPEELVLPTNISVSEEIKEPVEQVKVQKKSPYSIQVAAFRNKDSAEYAVTELKSQKYDAALRQSGDWYQVYIGGYSTKEDAEEDSWKVADDYPDCYIKRNE